MALRSHKSLEISAFPICEMRWLDSTQGFRCWLMSYMELTQRSPRGSIMWLTECVVWILHSPGIESFIYTFTLVSGSLGHSYLHFESGLGHVNWFGQWDISRHDVLRGLKCSRGQSLPSGFMIYHKYSFALVFHVPLTPDPQETHGRADLSVTDSLEHPQMSVQRRAAQISPA